MYLLANMGCMRAEVESDCTFVMESVHLMDNYQGPDVAVVAECKQLFVEFAKITFKHCFREANQVADELAKQSFRSNSSSSWDAIIPDFISHHLVNDLTVI